MFESIIDESLTLSSFLICTCVAIILGLLISYVYSKVSDCSKNYCITLAVLPLLVQLVIMVTNGNLGTSIATLGAFSLVRFRSQPGNSKEIVCVFLSMAIGLCIGVGLVGYACIMSVIVCIILYILSKSSFGNPKTNKILKIVIPEDLDYTDCFSKSFKKYLDENELLSAKTTSMGSLFELKYKVKLKKDINEKEFIDDLRVLNGNLNISLTNPIMEEQL